MKKRRLYESFNSAIEGFFYVLRTQRNMRVHFLLATLVFTFGIYLNLPQVELLILLGSLILLLALEMVNTAMELAVDLVKDTYHPLARIIKDVTAGAVFLVALNVAAVSYIIFSKRLALSIETGIDMVVLTPWHLTFIALLFVLLLVLVGKVFFHSGTPFRGGMPSGHAAFAFSIWTIVLFLTKNAVIVILVFVMAFLIARHRLKDSIHTALEVVAGAVLGALATALVFQLLL